MEITFHGAAKFKLINIYNIAEGKTNDNEVSLHLKCKMLQQHLLVKTS